MKSGRTIQKGLSTFCRSMQGEKDGNYRFSEGCPTTLSASAFAGLTLGLTGDLEKLDAAEKKNWVKYLQSCQDEKTGLFINPEFRKKDLHSTKHTEDLLHAHHSAFVMGLLIQLGSKPEYPIAWVHPYREPEKMRGWIESLSWDDPWLVGNWTYDMGCAMGIDYSITGNQQALEGMEAYFEWFDKHQMDTTGWWDPRGGSELYSQQFGGYHTLMVYWMFDRPIGKADKIIDSSLSLQKEDGMFAPDGQGGCCEDMDVIDPLVTLGLASGYRRNDIAAALEKALPPILAKRNEDGGIYDTMRWERAEFGWQLCKAKRGASDLCSCYFYGFVISLIGEYLKDQELLNTPWHHHQTYCHCVHKQAKLK